MSKYIVRKLDPTEAGSAARVIIDVVEDEANRSNAFRIEVMEKKLVSNKCLVLLRDDEIVGVAVYTLDDDSVYRREHVRFIEHFVVKEDNRFNRGVFELWSEVVKRLSGKPIFLITKDPSTFEGFVEHVYSFAVEKYHGTEKLYRVKQEHVDKIMKLRKKSHG